MKIRRLDTADDVIDALGGNKPFSRLISTRTKKRQDQHASNYRAGNYLPADTFLVVTHALKERGCTASPRLWGMKLPAGWPAGAGVAVASVACIVASRNSPRV